MRSSLKEMIPVSCEYYCLTTDIWSDRSMRSYMALTLHYLDADFVMHIWTLEVEHFPGKHTGEAIAKALTKTLDRWGLDKLYCMRLVRDGASNAVSAGNSLGIQHASCIAHSLHLVVGSAMLKNKKSKANSENYDQQFAPDEVEEDVETPTHDVEIDDEASSASKSEEHEYETNVASVIAQLEDVACDFVDSHVDTRLEEEKESLNDLRAIVEKFRSFAVYARKSPKAKARLLKIRKQLQPTSKLWLQNDCATRWSSTNAMLSRFIQLKPVVENFFAYLHTVPGKREFGRIQHTAPSQENWLAIECLVMLLEPFASVTTHLGGANYPTLVAVVPALRFIRKELNNEHIFDQQISLAKSKFDVSAVSDLLHRVRKAILRVFDERFSVQDLQLQWTSYLDPRFSEMNYLTIEEAQDAQRRLIDAALEVAKTLEHKAEEHQQTMIDPKMLSPEKSMTRLMTAMYGSKSKPQPAAASGSTTSDIQIRKRCESEFVLYVKEASHVTHRQNPLKWWRSNGDKFLVLAVLARRWLCCVATSVPAERAFSRGGNVVTAKRCALAPSTVRDTIFIAENC